MKTLLTVCLLATFIATGSSLQCPVCETGGRNCEGTMQACPKDHDTCALILSERSMGKQNNIRKKCIELNMCDKGLAVLDMGNGKTILSQVSCCKGEDCKKAPTPLPARNSTASQEKKQCPACYSEMNGCEEKTIECSRADEVMCAESYYQTLNSERKNVTTTMKGCANQAFCDNMKLFPLGVLLPQSKCVPASRSARTIPGLMGLFISVWSGFLFVAAFQ
ncbi:phospholipase A2 inhibitor gamma subunit B-like [Sceloporus undulatus]|uniref:phospholipase A2 inhibitor gamma subunit B-like n=1 Tax=Sceloporus undulatus TaxID=8520 RepID=UPI001C4AC447|nr:phospholipase A2 inhibitor gamma subunit B-like [Sceloporus undulatus]